MIVVTRLNGGRFGVNPDLVQRVDATPDTVLTLVDGTRYLVEETLDEVVELVQAFRAEVLARSRVVRPAPRMELLRGGDDEPPVPPVHPAPPGGPLRPRPARRP